MDRMTAHNTWEHPAARRRFSAYHQPMYQGNCMQSIKNDIYCSYTSHRKRCRMQGHNKHHNKTQLCGSSNNPAAGWKTKKRKKETLPPRGSTKKNPATLWHHRKILLPCGSTKQPWCPVVAQKSPPALWHHKKPFAEIAQNQNFVQMTNCTLLGPPPPAIRLTPPPLKRELVMP